MLKLIIIVSFSFNRLIDLLTCQIIWSLLKLINCGKTKTGNRKQLNSCVTLTVIHFLSETHQQSGWWVWMCATWKLSLRKHSVKLVPCTDYSWQQTSFSMFRSLSSFSFLKWLKWRCDDLLGFISIIWILWVSAETINIYITRWIHN